MLLIAKPKGLPPVHETSSSSELLKQIDHYFPDLSGWLKALRDAFEEGVRADQVEVEAEATCPCCGAKLQLNERTAS